MPNIANQRTGLNFFFLSFSKLKIKNAGGKYAGEKWKEKTRHP
jgi:hypothetical protein